MTAGPPCGWADDHCCWIAGQPCPHLVEHQAGRRWACSLMIELGQWEQVHGDARYERDVAVHLRARGLPDCGDWPPPEGCATCGAGRAD